MATLMELDLAIVTVLKMDVKMVWMKVLRNGSMMVQKMVQELVVSLEISLVQMMDCNLDDYLVLKMELQ